LDAWTYQQQYAEWNKGGYIVPVYGTGLPCLLLYFIIQDTQW